MCGRFAFFAKGQFGYESLQLPEPPPFERYNIAPTQDILVIRSSPETGRPEWALLRWGLVSSWSKESSTKHLLINARAEGSKPSPPSGGLYATVAASSRQVGSMSGAARAPANTPISCVLRPTRSLPWPASGITGRDSKEK